MEENKDVLSLLEDIKNINKKRVFWSRISTILLALLVAGVLSLVPIGIKTLNNANKALTNANDAIDTAVEALDQAQLIMDDLSGTIDTLETAMGSVTKLVDDSSKELKTAFENINSIDFESMNKAIKDLGDVVEPLSKFFKKF